MKKINLVFKLLIVLSPCIQSIYATNDLNALNQDFECSVRPMEDSPNVSLSECLPPSKEGEDFRFLLNKLREKFIRQEEDWYESGRAMAIAFTMRRGKILPESAKRENEVKLTNRPDHRLNQRSFAQSVATFKDPKQ